MREEAADEKFNWGVDLAISIANGRLNSHKADQPEAKLLVLALPGLRTVALL